MKTEELYDKRFTFDVHQPVHEAVRDWPALRIRNLMQYVIRCKFSLMGLVLVYGSETVITAALNGGEWDLIVVADVADTHRRGLGMFSWLGFVEMTFRELGVNDVHSQCQSQN